MKRRDFITGSLVVGTHLAVPASAVLLSACGGSARAPAQTRFGAPTMGTVYNVSLIDGALDEDKLAHIRTGMENILSQVIEEMSTWESSSALSRFNASVETGWQAAPHDLVTVLDEALSVSRWSGGAFDATVGPLVDLWGFGPVGGRQDPPPTAQLNRAATEVGYHRLHADAHSGLIRKDIPGVHLDLSAIAKGFAADRMGAYLDEQGVSNYLIDIGGELRAGGHNDDDSAWRVAIERPEPGARAIQRVVNVSNRAIATSGDYRNFFETDGTRFSHTIDPRTGRPVDQPLASVTVVHERTMTADAMATALLVLGADEGYELAQESGIAAHFMSRGEHGLIERSTRAMQDYIVEV
jgi:FAD:protein FMN transferase